jgi:H+/Cl- antiporter ClcA
VARPYPEGGAAWRRLLIPLVGSPATGFLLFRYFPMPAAAALPQTKIALFLREGYIFRTVAGKFSLCSVSLASGFALGREGPAVQVGAGLAPVLGRKAGRLNEAEVYLNHVLAGISGRLMGCGRTGRKRTGRRQEWNCRD